MSENIKQIFDTNPTTTFSALDLMYLGRSPYGATDDFAFTYSSLIPINTKGDLFVWSTAATRLPAGANGTILQANSAATTGLAWSTATYPTTNILGDIVYSSANNVYSNLSGNTTSTKNFLTQTGTGTVSAAPVWGTISGSDVSGSALTKTDDTNVTLTLGGSPTTALLRAASLTLGWTGQLALSRGGTNASLTASNGGIVYSTATALAVLAGTATANRVLLSGSSTTPAWSTATYPATTTASQLLYSSSANTVTGLTSANRATLVTNTSGVPAWSSSMADGQIIIGSSTGAPIPANITAGYGIQIANSANGIQIVNTAPLLNYLYFTTQQYYDAGTTASQSGTTITGVGTTFTSNMVGGLVRYLSGEITIIKSFVNATTLIAADSLTVSSVGFFIQYNGVTAEDTGYLAVTNTTFTSNLVVRNATQYGILAGGGTSGNVTSTVLTDGQLLIGSSGNAAVASQLTAGNGVTINNSPGSITINASDSAAWIDVQSGTIITNLSVDTGYSINSGASLRTLPLPTTAAVGNWIQIDGNSSGLWKITQNAGQVIHCQNQSTTVGTGGSIAATQQWSCIKLRCVVANTEWVIESGNFTALTIV